jgi:hypothetical protein
MKQLAINRERLRLLTAALRSGEYQQGQGRLVTIDPSGVYQYCCLGVACEVAAANGLDLDVTVHSSIRVPYLPYKVTYNNETTQLPGAVRAWYGFSECDPRVSVEPLEPLSPGWVHGDIAAGIAARVGLRGLRAVHASRANDRYRAPFDLIADAFEHLYLD